MQLRCKRKTKENRYCVTELQELRIESDNKDKLELKSLYFDFLYV